MTLLRAPFPWFGGKSRAAGLVWERLGNVQNYVEPFAGSLAVLLARPTEPGTETVNDLPGSWECVAWKAKGGYGSQGTGRGRDNAARERVWFSPACLRPGLPLFSAYEATA